MVLNETLATVESIVLAQKVFQQAVQVGYWAVGGAIGITLLTFLAMLYYNHQVLTCLRRIVQQNERLAELLSKKRR